MPPNNRLKRSVWVKRQVTHNDVGSSSLYDATGFKLSQIIPMLARVRMIEGVRV